MKTTNPISIPNLRRDAAQAEIDEFISELVRTFHCPIKLEDEPDENGNCVIEATHGDPSVLESLIAAVQSRA